MQEKTCHSSFRVSLLLFLVILLSSWWLSSCKFHCHSLSLMCFLSYFFSFVVLTRETMSGKEWYTPLSVMLLFVSLRVQVKPPSAMIRSWDHLFCKPVVAFIFRLRDLFPISSQGLQQRKRRSEHIEDAILLLVLSSPLLSCSDLCDKKQFSE